MEGDEHVPEEAEENLYSEAVREDAVESDEISAGEEAFMKGYDEADEEEEEDKDKDKDKEKDEDEEPED